MKKESVSINLERVSYQPKKDLASKSSQPANPLREATA